jgi:hypothetical protein
MFARVVWKFSGAEITMSTPSDPNSDSGKLATDLRQIADENARLRKTNAQMLAALQYVLPILQDALPETVDYDCAKEAVAKVQNAIAEASRDP